jgi:hypothetical protein
LLALHGLVEDRSASGVLRDSSARVELKTGHRQQTKQDKLPIARSKATESHSTSVTTARSRRITIEKIRRFLIWAKSGQQARAKDRGERSLAGE